jgi:hypothetical protein
MIHFLRYRYYDRWDDPDMQIEVGHAVRERSAWTENSAMQPESDPQRLETWPDSRRIFAQTGDSAMQKKEICTD